MSEKMANKRLIDANALCDCFEKAAYKCEYIEDMVFHLDYILDEITGADEVDAVEVVHGLWYWKPLNETTFVLTCSMCGSQEGSCETYKYCPNCGAKMDGGNEDG